VKEERETKIICDNFFNVCVFLWKKKEIGNEEKIECILFVLLIVMWTKRELEMTDELIIILSDT
jgi:hypothetical protein